MPKNTAMSTYNAISKNTAMSKNNVMCKNTNMRKNTAKYIAKSKNTVSKTLVCLRILLYL